MTEIRDHTGEIWLSTTSSLCQCLCVLPSGAALVRWADGAIGWYRVDGFVPAWLGERPCDTEGAG